ncbi:hypothetical protein ES707_07462 [subsurface metagenome]
MRYCYFCGNPLEEQLDVFRSTLCPSCKKGLRICRNCRFYSPGAHWDCRESISEPVYEKERSNFCDFFKFVESVQEKPLEKEQGNKARQGFDNLFKNGM